MTKELFTCAEYEMPMVITPGALRETYVRSWRKRFVL